MRYRYSLSAASVSTDWKRLPTVSITSNERHIGCNTPAITNTKDQRGRGVSLAGIELDRPDVQINMINVSARKMVDQVRYIIGNAKASQTCRYSLIDCRSKFISRSHAWIFIHTYGD